MPIVEKIKNEAFVCFYDIIHIPSSQAQGRRILAEGKNAYREPPMTLTNLLESALWNGFFG